MKYLSLLLLIISPHLWSGTLGELKKRYERPTTIPFPKDNPYSAYKATLGKMLFFDPRLSKHQNMSCASCHNPSFGWESANDRSIGAQNTALGRHTPTSINMAWSTTFFWDGRADTLEQQAVGPIENTFEMNIAMGDLLVRLNNIAGYKALFNRVFDDGITSENIGKAIATFERTVVSGSSDFDRWIEGDETAISEQAKKGFELFNGKAACADCHSGWNFTDNQFHDIGLATEDFGRYKIDASSEKNKHAFKTPGLRNISQRAPYMHHGNMNTLSEVIIHYVTGGIKRPSLSDKMQPVPLSQEEIKQLTVFLETIQGEDKKMPLPILPL